MRLGQPKNKSRRATTPIILMFPENFSLNSIILNACKQHGFYPTIACADQPMAPLSRHGVTTYGDRASSSILYRHLTDFICSSATRKTKYSMALSHGLEKIFLFSPAVQAWLSIVRQHFQHIKPNVEIAIQNR